MSLFGHEAWSVLLIINVYFQTIWAIFLYFSDLSCFKTLTLNLSLFLPNSGFFFFSLNGSWYERRAIILPLCRHFSRLGNLILAWKGRSYTHPTITFTTSAFQNIGPVTPYLVLHRQVSIVFLHLYLLIKVTFKKCDCF